MEQILGKNPFFYGGLGFTLGEVFPAEILSTDRATDQDDFVWYYIILHQIAHVLYIFNDAVNLLAHMSYLLLG
jgi:hypothetical protein